jgi:hypothetical protein
MVVPFYYNILVGLFIKIMKNYLNKIIFNRELLFYVVCFIVFFCLLVCGVTYVGTLVEELSLLKIQNSALEIRVDTLSKELEFLKVSPKIVVTAEESGIIKNFAPYLSIGFFVAYVLIWVFLVVATDNSHLDGMGNPPSGGGGGGNPPGGGTIALERALGTSSPAVAQPSQASSDKVVDLIDQHQGSVVEKSTAVKPGVSISDYTFPPEERHSAHTFRHGNTFIHTDGRVLIEDIDELSDGGYDDFLLNIENQEIELVNARMSKRKPLVFESPSYSSYIFKEEERVSELSYLIGKSIVRRDGVILCVDITKISGDEVDVIIDEQVDREFDASSKL